MADYENFTVIVMIVYNLIAHVSGVEKSAFTIFIFQLNFVFIHLNSFLNLGRCSRSIER